MKKVGVILFLVFSYPVFSQSSDQESIFNDTSLYFNTQTDSLNPVLLSPGELAIAEQLLIQGTEKFNEAQRLYADSVNPKKKRRKAQALQINANLYFYRLIPALNKENQKVIWICGDCKNLFNSGKRHPVYEKDWKGKFVDGNIVMDGGSCFIYLVINLTLKTHDQLVINGEG